MSLEAGLWTGVVGDAGLQVLSRYDVGKNWGLRPYFAQHGIAESLMLAGGLMATVGSLLQRIDPTQSYTLGFAYGVGLDVLFRQARIMPSLDSYYSSLGPITTAIWGGIPVVLTIWVDKQFF